MPDPALLTRGHALAADAGLWDSDAELMARCTAVLGEFMQMMAGVAVKVGPMGIVGIVRRFPGPLGDLRYVAVASVAHGRTGRALGGCLLVTRGALHAGFRVLVGQQVCPDARQDPEGQRREQHEEDEEN